MKENEFAFRIKNIELRSSGKHLESVGEHTTAEIVKWFDNKSYYTISYWVQDTEGYDIRFVKDRAFGNDINWQDFKMLLELGQDILDYNFNKEDK